MLKSILLMLEKFYCKEKNEHITFNHDDYTTLINSISSFIFLAELAKVRYYNDIELIDKAFLNNTFISDIYYENTTNYEKLMRNDSFKKEYTDKGFPVLLKKVGSSSNIIVDHLYIKKDDKIEKYFVLHPNFEFLVFQYQTMDGKHKYQSIKIPLMTLKEEFITKYEKFIQVKDGTQKLYYIPRRAFYNIFSKEKFPEKTLNEEECFVEDDKLVVYKPFYEHSDYKIIPDIIKNMSSIIVFNSKGEILNNYSYPVILHKILTNIRHFKQLSYNIRYKNYITATGLIFLPKEKNKNDKSLIYQRAYSIDWNVMRYLPKIANNFRINNDNCFQFIFTPKQKIQINIDEFLNQCKFIFIKLENAQTKIKVKELVEDILSKYEKTNNIKDLKDLIEKFVNKNFGPCQIVVKDIENKDFIKEILLNKPVLFEKKYRNNNFLEDYLKISISKFYGFELIKNPNFINKENKLTDIIHPYIEGVTINLDSIFRNFFRSFINKINTDFNKVMRVFENEMYISICFLFLYKNIVENNFFEDLYEKNNRAIEVFDKLDFSKFIVNGKPFEQCDYDKNQMKYIILKSIRDSISHYTIAIRLSSLGWRESLVSFLYEFDDLKYGIKLTTKDLFDFLLNYDLCNYSKENSFIYVNSFEDFKKAIKSILEQQKELSR